MKRAAVIALCIVFVFSVTACGGGGSSEDAGDSEGAVNSGSEDGESYELVIGHVYSTDSLESKMTEYLKEQIESRTDGRVQVTIYPNEMLGSERETCEQVVLGTCDITFSEGSMWSTVTGVTELGVYGLPFMYTNTDSANYAVKELIRPGLGKICEDNELPIVPLYTVQSGFRHLFTVKKPVYTMADLAGMKVRVPEVDLYVSIWRYLGANPTTTAFSEVYQALSSGVVEACEIDFANAIQQNWQEIVRHCSLTGHLAALNVAMINKDKLASFPEDIQQILWECTSDAEDYNHQNRADADAEYLATLVDANVEIIELEPSVLAEMRAACQPIYDEFIALGVEDLIDVVAKADADAGV
jgi:C4-dicarboxylate-binding protein DctP